eukprot:762973-Hanusia_phi.AAC.2
MLIAVRAFQDRVRSCVCPDILRLRLGRYLDAFLRIVDVIYCSSIYAYLHMILRSEILNSCVASQSRSRICTLSTDRFCTSVFGQVFWASRADLACETKI